MKKNVPALRIVERDDAPEVPELSDEMRSTLTEVIGVAREGLLTMSVSVGLAVFTEMMHEELTQKVGAKHAKSPERAASRHGTALGSVVLGGRRVTVTRPRARSAAGQEVCLQTYGAFARDDQLGADVEANASSTSRSAVSRRFVARTVAALAALMARDLSELDVVALMIDGVHFAEHCCVVALAVLADGTKVPIGLWLGSTENATVVTQLLADVQDRGLCADRGLLVVIDGGKALAAGVKRVLGNRAVVQRCTLHKRRNVTDHLPKDQRGWVDQRLARAFNHPDPAKGLRQAKDLARQLEVRWPDAAGSLREGSMTCSASDDWVSRTGSPAASPTPT